MPKPGIVARKEYPTVIVRVRRSRTHPKPWMVWDKYRHHIERTAAFPDWAVEAIGARNGAWFEARLRKNWDGDLVWELLRVAPDQDWDGTGRTTESGRDDPLRS